MIPALNDSPGVLLEYYSWFNQAKKLIGNLYSSISFEIEMHIVLEPKTDTFVNVEGGFDLSHGKRLCF
jgi:hypothetical protein